MGDRLVDVLAAATRVVAAIFALVGVGLVSAGYPPGGTEAYLTMAVGGVFVLVGVVGVRDPAAFWRSDRPANDRFG